MEADDNFLSVGVYRKKVESIKIKDNKYLVDVFSNKKITPVDNTIKDTFERSETKLYRILSDNKE